MNKKAIKYAIMFVLLSTIIQVPTANAISEGDTAWQQATGLIVSAQTSFNKPDIDISKNWATIITSNTSPTFTIAKTYFTNCMNSINGQWSVTQVEINIDYPGRKDVIVNCSSNIATTFNFNTTTTPKIIEMNAPAQEAYQYRIVYSQGGGDGCAALTACLLSASKTISEPVSASAQNANGQKYLGYFIKGTINYPIGYEGQTIRNTAPMQLDQNSIVPAWRYAVADKNLEVQSLITDKQITENNITTCMFQIPNNKYGDNYSEYEYNCNIRPSVKHIFNEMGTYNVIHRIKNSDGQWFESSRSLTVDGSSYSGIIGNNGTSNSIIRALEGIVTNTHGLSSIITAPLAFISELPAAVNTCAPINLNIGNFGTITLPCMTNIYQSKFGVIFTTWQTVIIGLFTYHMCIRIFGKIKDMSNPKDDSIEVVNL